MAREAVACAKCGERDIPPRGWLWFDNRRPVHPWCVEIWRRLDAMSRLAIRRMVDQVRRSA